VDKGEEDEGREDDSGAEDNGSTNKDNDCWWTAGSCMP
jgi:hypothetical protein